MLGLFPPHCSYQTVCGNLCPFLILYPFLSLLSFPLLLLLSPYRFSSYPLPPSLPFPPRQLLFPAHFLFSYPLPPLFLFHPSIPLFFPPFLRTYPIIFFSATPSFLPYSFSPSLSFFPVPSLLIYSLSPSLTLLFSPPFLLYYSFSHYRPYFLPSIPFSPTISFLPSSFLSPVLPTSPT